MEFRWNVSMFQFKVNILENRLMPTHTLTNGWQQLQFRHHKNKSSETCALDARYMRDPNWNAKQFLGSDAWATTIRCNSGLHSEISLIGGHGQRHVRDKRTGPIYSWTKNKNKNDHDRIWQSTAAATYSVFEFESIKSVVTVRTTDSCVNHQFIRYSFAWVVDHLNSTYFIAHGQWANSIRCRLVVIVNRSKAFVDRIAKIILLQIKTIWRVQFRLIDRYTEYIVVEMHVCA